MGDCHYLNKNGSQNNHMKVEKCFKGANEVAVLGFSQGGCLALHVGLGTRPATAPDMKSVICISSFLANDSSLVAQVTKRDR